VATSDDLWGSQLTAVTFDPVGHTCALSAVAYETTGDTSYVITCTSVTDLTFHSSIPEPWTYADVTEVYITEDGSGQQLLELMLWSEDAGIEIRCAQIDITEVAPG